MTDKVLFVQSPEELLGLAGELAETQEQVGQITVEEFQTQFDRSHTFLDHISWNPKQVKLRIEYLAAPGIPHKLNRAAQKVIQWKNQVGFQGKCPWIPTNRRGCSTMVL